MLLLIASFLAGVLTVLAPCVLPLLPIIIGGSIADDDQSKRGSFRRPIIISLSLVASLVLFSLLLQASTALLGVPTMVWQIISGIIVIGLGLTFVFPITWAQLSVSNRLHNNGNRLLASSQKQSGITRDILVGAALGPIFTSCSPTYSFILAAILPKSYIEGLVYLIAYCVGLALALLALSYGGSRLIKRLGWLINPYGNIHKIIGLVFIIVGLLVIIGFDKTIQTYVLEQGWYDPIGRFEEQLR